MHTREKLSSCEVRNPKAVLLRLSYNCFTVRRHLLGRFGLLKAGHKSGMIGLGHETEMAASKNRKPLRMEIKYLDTLH